MGNSFFGQKHHKIHAAALSRRGPLARDRRAFPAAAHRKIFASDHLSTRPPTTFTSRPSTTTCCASSCMLLEPRTITILQHFVRNPAHGILHNIHAVLFFRTATDNYAYRQPRRVLQEFFSPQERRHQFVGQSALCTSARSPRYHCLGFEEPAHASRTRRATTRAPAASPRACSLDSPTLGRPCGVSTTTSTLRGCSR